MIVSATFAGIPRVAGLASLVDGLDALFVDQFGVLHDGIRLYPGVVAALEAVAERALPVVVLTNSGKPSAASRKRLVRLGLPARLFAHVVSSGDRVRTMMATSSSLVTRKSTAYVIRSTSISA